MCEVAAMCEVHRKNFIAGREHAEIDGHIRLAAAVRLHIDMLCAEELLRALDGECFHDVHILAASIPTARGITFGVFVGEAGSLGLHHGATGEILGGDQLDVLELAFVFLLDGCCDFGVGFSERGDSLLGFVGCRHGFLINDS